MTQTRAAEAGSSSARSHEGINLTSMLQAIFFEAVGFAESVFLVRLVRNTCIHIVTDSARLMSSKP